MIKKIKINFKWIRAFGVVILFSLLAFYVYQINAETSEKYSIQDYQKRILDISKENKGLEINSAQMSSLDSIAQTIKGLEFEETGEIHYIQVLEAQVVIR